MDPNVPKKSNGALPRPARWSPVQPSLPVGPSPHSRPPPSSVADLPGQSPSLSQLVAMSLLDQVHQNARESSSPRGPNTPTPPTRDEYLDVLSRL